MANYANLIALVNAAIKTNGVQAITGQLLQTVLGEIIGSLGTGYQFIGIATPETEPGTPDQNVCYLAGAGVYDNFDNLEVSADEIAVLKWDGEWSKEALSLSSAIKINTSLEDLKTEEGGGATFEGQTGYTVAEVVKAGAVVYEDDNGALNYYLVAGTNNLGEAPDEVVFVGHNKIYVVAVDGSGEVTSINDYPIGIDAAPTENSFRAVSSGGVYTALAAKQNVLTFDNVPTAGSANPVKSGGVYSAMEQKANIDGQYDTLTSGYAGNLIDKSDVGSEQQIMFRKTGGTTEVAESTRAMFKRLLGRSLVWNQLIQNGDFSNGTTGWNAYHSTIEISDGVMRVNYNGASEVWIYQDSVLTLGARRVIYAEAYVRCATAKKAQLSWWGVSYGATTLVAGQWTKVSAITIVNPSYATYTRMGVKVTEMSEGDYYEVRSIRCTDLTAMYGAGYEPGTVAEFENVYNKPYYPHNAGTFIHNVAQTYEAVGFNQFDESLLIDGKWRDMYGVESDSAGRRRSDEYSPVISGVAYYVIGNGNSAYTAVICFYDANKNYIAGYSLGNGGVITSPVGAVYYRMSTASATNTICVNLSNPDLNGTYAPYVKATTTLGLSAFRVKDGQGNITTVNGLESAGDVYDEIDLVKKKYIKRIGVVNLGTLNYTYNSTLNMFANQFFEDSPTVRRGLICQKYAAVRVGFSSMPDKSIAFNNYYTGSIYNALTIKDSAYTDKNVFKAAMNGVLLYYEIAEPVVYDLVDDMPTDCQTWGVGTENILPEGVDENGVPLTTPLRAVIYYPKDYTGIINNLPKTYISTASLTNMLNALKSAGVITSFTMTWNSLTQTYNFTIS